MSGKENQKLITKQLCRELRKNSTGSEKIFWETVRNRKFENKKFYRQYPIFFDYHDKQRFFIADFYCHEERLIVELDGKMHDFQKDYDELRTYIINTVGIKVIRFKNEEIENKLDMVLDELRKFMN